MKVGDKVVCITEVNFGINWEGIEHIYKKNNIYEIIYVYVSDNDVKDHIIFT